jgi:hypothetical protein
MNKSDAGMENVNKLGKWDISETTLVHKTSLLKFEKEIWQRKMFIFSSVRPSRKAEKIML